MTTTAISPQVIRSVRPMPIPPLANGDHLTRTEFERRYAAHPHIKKAELIEEVVYIPSPVHLEKHSKPHSRIVGWLFKWLHVGLTTAEHQTFVAQLQESQANVS